MLCYHIIYILAMMKTMSKFAAALAAICALAAGSASAAPRVVTDLPAVHALASKVMEGVGAPGRILPPGAEPHGYHMRPSEAAALAKADVLIWIGPELTPWLDRVRQKLNPGVKSLRLLMAPGAVKHDLREEALFEPEDDHQKHDHHKDAHHKDSRHKDGHHDDHKDGDKEDHKDAHGHGDGHDHGDSGIDPHAWLDPENGARWLGAIAKALGAADPDNAAAYAANAAAGEAELRALTESLNGRLAPVRGRSYVVMHDAYQYFEARFRMPALGSIRLSDGASPSPRRIAGLKRGIEASGARCIFREPQYSASLANSLTGPGVKSGVMDPLGWRLEPGWRLYPALLTDLAAALTDCLGD